MEGIAGMQNGPRDAILKWTDVMDPLSRLKEQTINPETRIEYTIDLTRQYHNLLQKEEDGNTQSYLWDGNVAGMREDMGTASHYYFQDELGSPVRLMDKNGELAESYGYDEFGQELYWDREKTAGRSMTGSIQPFGYTGYQYDRTAGTYYAQAREYRAELGRFAAVDTIKGFMMAPYTLNEYGYCWGNPMILVDLDGKFPSLSDIGNSIKSAASSVVNTVTDIADKAVETVKDVADKTVETVKNVASDIKGAAKEFYNEHKKVIDTIAKVTLTVGIGAVAVLGGIAIAAAVPAGLAASAAVAMGVGIVSSGVVGGVIGGVSNSMTGGSFLNGFCGGFANGCITSAGVITGHPVLGNFIGGLVGNEITENFNNMDITNPQDQKSQSAIFTTSILMGGIQTIIGGPIGAMGETFGLAKGTLGYYIAELFGQDLSFMISNGSYLFIDGILKYIEDYIENRKNESEAECLE